MPRAEIRWLPFAIGAAGILAGWLVSVLLPGYLVFLTITAVIAALSLIGLGIVTGSAGMVALCQLTFAAVGAWVVCLLNVAAAPGGFLAWLIAGAIAAGFAGVVLGLPALRLRGVNLAVVTLGFAAAADAMLLKTQFPGSLSGIRVPRPELFADDRAYLVLAVIVLVLVALAVHLLQSSRWGSGWRSVAYSERGTAAAGTSVRVAKISAFAVSATIAGLAGGLIAGQVGTAYPSAFSTLQSLALYVLSIVSGSYLIEMAVVGGILWVLIPELLKRFGVPQDWGFVVFGVLGVQALTTGSNLGQDLRDAVLRRRRADAPAASRPAEPADGPDAAAEPGAPLLVVEGLTVRFGALAALDGVDLTVHEGEIVGLIGPNGAGKSTFVDAVSGFLPGHGGTVRLGSTTLDGLPPHRRARAGLRRTFQQDRVPPSLTVGAYVRFLARRPVPSDRLAELLEYFGCPPAGSRIRDIDVGTRRILEVAAALAAAPRVLILDEPAAGLSHEEHLVFGRRLRRVPARFGTALLVIEHDLDLVRTVCSRITVLNFGAVLADGTRDEVLRDPAVIAAYMGETELL